MSLFRKPKFHVIYVPLVEGVEPEGESPEVREPRTFNLSLSMRELAALYAFKGWQVDGARGPDSVPDAVELTGLAVNLAERVAENPDAAYSTTARLMALRDEDFPGAIDLYLYLGNVEIDPPDDDDDDESDPE